MAFLEDIAAMDADVGAALGDVPVQYQPSAGAPVSLVGLFDAGNVVQSPFESTLDNIGPSVFLRREELEKLSVDVERDAPTLTIDGIQYQVRQRVHDGPAGGGVRLMLSEVG